MKKKYTAIEAFCGPGGMGLGIKNAGFDILFAFDLNEKAVETYRKNLGNHVTVADAQYVKGQDILKKLELKCGDIDLFAGGPPCQGFSKQKKGAHLGDERNYLILEFLRLIKEIRPKYFILENVAIFGQKRGRDYISAIEENLLEYVLVPHFYNAADYGLAQTRERFVMVGSRNDMDQWYEVPHPTHENWATVGEVLAGIPEPPTDYTEHPKYPNHQRAKVTEINIKRFSFVPQGGGWQDIPKRYQIPSHKKLNPKVGGWPDVYGRLKMDGQCPTITGGFDSFTRGRYGHPIYNRPLTPREAARLQGFPDRYKFLGTRSDVRSQIGNAVPPPLAKVIANKIKSCLKNSKKNNSKWEPNLYTLEKNQQMALRLMEEIPY